MTTISITTGNDDFSLDEGDLLAEKHVILLDKFKVQSWCFDSVVSQFNTMRPFLMPGEAYTWQELLGDEFWSDMPDLPVHLACLCLKHMASQPDAPFALHDFGAPYFEFR